MDGKMAKLLKRPWVRVVSVGVLLGGYAVAVTLAFVFSLLLGTSVFAEPFLAILAFAIHSFGLWLVLTLLASHYLELRGQKWISAITLAACIAPYVYPWHPRMQFVSRFESVPIGTSELDLLSRMEPYLDVRDWKEGRRTSLIFRWNDHWAYESDHAVFELKDGRVVSKNFHFD